MFNEFYMEYKNYILKDGVKSIKDLMPYEIFSLSILIIGVILTIILSFFKFETWSIAPLSLIIVSLAILYFFRRKPNEIIRISRDRTIYARKRYKKVLELLNKYDVDTENHKQIDMLIDYATENMKGVDLFDNTKFILKHIFIYLLVPLVTVLLNGIFLKLSYEEVIMLSLVIFLFMFLFIAFGILFYTIFNDLLNREKFKYRRLISDLKEVKAFGKMSIILSVKNE